MIIKSLILFILFNIIILSYRPDLFEWNSIEAMSAEESNEMAFNIFEEEFKIPPVISSE